MKKYVLVGSYKTKPAEEGWYSGGRYVPVWRKISKRFGVNVTHKDSFPALLGIPPITFGAVKGINDFFFYDLKLHDLNAIDLDGKKITKDKELFPKYCKDFCNGLNLLFEWIKNDKNFIYRLGVQSWFVAGLIIYYFQNKGCLGLCQMSFKDIEGLLEMGENTIDLGVYIENNFKVSLPANIEIFKINNSTARFPDTQSTEFDNSWDDFFEIIHKV